MNHLFAGSDKGAERLAIAYTIFNSCHRHGVNPLERATDVLGKLQDGWPRAHLDALLPDAWARSASPFLWIVSPRRDRERATRRLPRCRDVAA
jgi:hypothetical protein